MRSPAAAPTGGCGNRSKNPSHVMTLGELSGTLAHELNRGARRGVCTVDLPEKKMEELAWVHTLVVFIV